MTVCHCIKLVKETNQNKSKRSKNEEERPKHEEKIAKCEEIELSENFGEKGSKSVQPLEYSCVTSSNITRDSDIRATLRARYRSSRARWLLFLSFFLTRLIHYELFLKGNSALFQGLQKLALQVRFLQHQG